MQFLFITSAQKTRAALLHDAVNALSINATVIPAEEAKNCLSRKRYTALIVDLSDAEQAGFLLLQSLLVADVAGEINCPPYLLACSTTSEAVAANRVYRQGYDQLLSLPLSEKKLHDSMTSVALTQPDLSELRHMAGEQKSIIEAMKATLLQSLATDITELKMVAREGTMEQLAGLAHRMKSSWYLLGMRNARRNCLAVERLSGHFAAGVFLPQQELPLRQHFLTAMQNNYATVVRQLTICQQQQN